jgi:Uma2 family endonuclease
VSPEQYLEIERQAERKSEFRDGEMFAMPGANEAHNQVVVSIASELHSQFRSRQRCVYLSDMRVRVNPTRLYAYPDVVAVCGESRFMDDEEDTLLNPALLVEVLSPSTEAYDRGRNSSNTRRWNRFANICWSRPTECMWIFTRASRMAAGS